MMLRINAKGQGLLGVMISMSIGAIVVLGVGKTLMDFSEQSKSIIRKTVITEAKRNIVRILKSERAWTNSATISQELSENDSSCAPSVQTGDHAPCAFALGYNPNNQLTGADYSDATKGFITWVCPVRNSEGSYDFQNKGVGFTDLDGKPYPLDRTTAICTTAADPEDEFKNQTSLHGGRYLKVTVTSQDTAPTTLVTIPNMTVEIADMGGSGHIFKEEIHPYQSGRSLLFKDFRYKNEYTTGEIYCSDDRELEYRDFTTSESTSNVVCIISKFRSRPEHRLICALKKQDGAWMYKFNTDAACWGDPNADINNPDCEFMCFTVE